MKHITELAIGRHMRCRGALCGIVTFVVWDPPSGRMTHLVVQPEGRERASLVPTGRTLPTPDWIEFDGTLADFRTLDGADEGQFLRYTERDWGDRSDHVLVRAPGTGAVS